MVDEVKVAEKNKTLESLRKIDDNLRLPSVPERRVFPKEIDVAQARMQTPAVGQRATRPDGRMHGLRPCILPSGRVALCPTAGVCIRA